MEVFLRAAARLFGQFVRGPFLPELAAGLVRRLSRFQDRDDLCSPLGAIPAVEPCHAGRRSRQQPAETGLATCSRNPRDLHRSLAMKPHLLTHESRPWAGFAMSRCFVYHGARRSGHFTVSTTAQGDGLEDEGTDEGPEGPRPDIGEAGNTARCRGTAGVTSRDVTAARRLRRNHRGPISGRQGPKRGQRGHVPTSLKHALGTAVTPTCFSLSHLTFRK